MDAAAWRGGEVSYKHCAIVALARRGCAPLAEGSAQTRAPELARRLLWNGHVKSRVLIVEPEPQACDGLAELLRDDGYDVRTASTGREAMDTLQSFAADWVIIELDLQDMSGAWLACTVTSWPHPPRVLCVAARDSGRACCAEIIAKPIDYKDLVTRLRKASQSDTIAA